MSKFFSPATSVKMSVGDHLTPGIRSGIILTPWDFSMSYADFADEEKIWEAIAAENMYPLVGCYVEDNTPDVAQEENPLSEAYKTHVPPTRMMYNWYMGLNTIKELESFDHQRMRMFILTTLGNMIGTKNNADTHVMGFSTKAIEFYPPISPSAENRLKGRLRIQEANQEEWYKFGHIQPINFMGELDGIESVVVPETATVTTNEFTITLMGTDESTRAADGTARSYPITDAVKEQLRLIDQNNAVLDPATEFTLTHQDGNPGTYDVDATVGGLTSGSAQFIPITDPSVKLLKSNICVLSA